jgi:phosphoribosylformylglycinamidine synthase
MIKIAVLLFPGINMEIEMMRAIEAVGMKASIVRWNQFSMLEKYDGYVIPGGFSYEDRVRAGVIASKDRMMEILREESREDNKPILGVCNGCQILVESGIVPGFKNNEVEMALAPNINPLIQGYYNSWVYIKSTSKKKRCAFNYFYKANEVIPIAIAHGEGRFTTQENDLLEKLIENEQIIFRYCDKEGDISEKFPINPNGSLYNIAGICNKKGNVMAMMPHPERVVWKKHIPGFQGLNFEILNSFAPGVKIFQSMKTYIEEEIK